MEARDLPAGTSRREELSCDRTSGLGPNAGQPLGRSSVLPADGSVRMETEATAPGRTSRRFGRLESRKITVPLVKELHG